MEAKKNRDANQQIAKEIADANSLLQALKAESTTPPLPAQVQANLQRAFRAQVATSAHANMNGENSLSLSHRGWRAGFVARLAPLFAVIAVMAGATAILMSAQQNNVDNNSWEGAKTGHVGAPFIALKDIKLIALELNTTIVETQLSPMQLVRLGIPVNPSNTASAIPAQVLMSDSGEALALKLDY
jgi:hypothetical protein